MKPNSESIADELHKGQEKATDVIKYPSFYNIC